MISVFPFGATFGCDVTIGKVQLMSRPIKECAVEKQLLIRIKAAGGVAEKVTVLGARGFFDRLVVLPGGRVFFVELKRPTDGRISPHQILRHKRYRELGVSVRIIKNSADIDRLMSEV
jgi:hypothetical protein